ncbi:glycoside hydrolase family 28 protein [Sphingobacterium gobiense]|uniref:Glycoside hydrolase n=1 Tax=Sphingobacterium gobiense TaxID=1382456 RepID=A0A2S9JVS1_9SPHI|nr:glycoside hydrolase family 28 protein [Sphingobacterium gobiense]PRD57357.1 glycoside hydrolase [Sphingobacterium gobiense]
MATFKNLSFFAIILLIISSCGNSVTENLSRIKKRDQILSLITPPSLSTNLIDLQDFGALGDSLTDNKPAFDKALEKCKSLGGGRIIVPPGIYLVNGPIHLISNVTLDLQKGAKLVFGSNPDDYLPAVLTSWEGTFLYNYSPFIYAYQAENVAIIGEGVIDGNSEDTFSTWHAKQKPSQTRSRKMNHEDTPIEERVFGAGHYLRPHLVQFFECKNILIEDVTLSNSPFWCVHLLKSENITARRVKFDAFNKNNDGFDPEYSKNILIEDIDFNNADDNVAIKAGRDHEGRKTGITSENIIIRNCRFKGLHGVVIGSEMSAGVQNVFVENCTFGGYCKRGIYLKSNPDRGGFIRDIYVNNVEFGEVEDCFFITSYYHGEGSDHETDIRDIFVDDLRCNKVRNAALVIQGYPTKKVSDIHFSNIQIDTAKTAVSFTNAENIVFNNLIIGDEVKVPSHVQ